MVRTGNQGAAEATGRPEAEWSNARHDADRPDAGNGIEQEFGVAHSSSQRSSDTIGNTPPPSCQSLLMTPAGPPPPAGVIVLPNAWPTIPTMQNPSSPCERSYRIQHQRAERMRLMHGCHSNRALLPAVRAGYILLMGRATISSSQRPRQGLAAPPPPKLPIDISNARRVSSPAGVDFFALQPTNPTWLVYLCDAKSGFWPEFRLNFRLTCTKRMGAIRQLRCPFSQRSVYSNPSDQGGAKDERPPSTQAHERGK